MHYTLHYCGKQAQCDFILILYFFTSLRVKVFELAMDLLYKHAVYTVHAQACAKQVCFLLLMKILWLILADCDDAVGAADVPHRFQLYFKPLLPSTCVFVLQLLTSRESFQSFILNKGSFLNGEITFGI